jgi:hypothetical protein
MSVALTQDLIDLVNDPSTVKVLVSVDAGGVPHASIEDSLHVAAGGTLHYLEPLESSPTNRNLVYGIWFDRTVAIALVGAGGRRVQIKGRPVKNHITGPLFLEHYGRTRERGDLAGVWEIVPEQVIEQDVEARSESERHPTFIHLDRIARSSAAP